MSSDTVSTLATIDVGTNTALMLVTRWEEGRLRVLHDETQFVRLGRGVDARGVINATSIGRLCDTLLYYKAVAEAWQVDEFVVAGTSASRDARNGAELVEIVRRTTGFEYIILSGLEEAEWSFEGVLSGMNDELETCLVLDIGGGSTELSLGRARQHDVVLELVETVSFDVGSVRLSERFFGGRPPDEKTIERASDWIATELARLPFEIPENVVMVGASGTTTSLAALKRADIEIEPLPAFLNPPLSLETVSSWRERLMPMDEAEVLALNPSVMRGRADVFPAGVLILELVMKVLRIPRVSVSTRGLRHGLALRYWTDRPARSLEHYA